MGIQINGQTDTISAVDNNFSLAGNVSVGGILTYEDVTNVDAVGLSTFQAGIHIDDSIAHLGDTDTKIRFPAADTVTVETGGSERLRVTSTGELNIGGSYTQTTNKLNVTGTAYVSSDITAGDDIIAADEIRNNVPGDFWATDNTFISLNGFGNLTHMGGYETNLTSNGYRDTNGQWQSLAANSNTGAAQIGLSPQGNIIFRTDASKSNGTAHNPTERLRITSAGQLNLAGNMQFTAATPEIELNNGGPRFRVPSANTLTIHTGGGLGATSNEKLRIQSGGGISFNGDTAAANALDDYEEGTFLPTMYGTTLAGTSTYSLQYGYYIKVGKLVHFQIRMTVASSTATGNMRIGGLPFVALNDANRGYASINVSYTHNISMQAGSTWMGAYTAAGGSHLVLVYNTPGSSITTASVDSSWTALIGGTYIANV